MIGLALPASGSSLTAVDEGRRTVSLDGFAGLVQLALKGIDELVESLVMIS